MAFSFSLATLLRLREIAAEREERLLGQILQQIAQSTQTLQDLESRRLRVCTLREQALSRRATGIELTGFYEQVRGIEDLQRSNRDTLAKLEVLRLQQVRAYEAAHRDQELLVNMRRSQEEQFRRELVRKEQALMDDVFSSRRSAAVKPSESAI